MLGREDQIGRAEHGVGPGREDRDLLAARGLEDELRPFAPADPVLLKEGGGGGPVEVLEVLEEALRVIREPPEPRLVLLHRPPSDRKSTRLNSSHGYISYAVFC